MEGGVTEWDQTANQDIPIMTTERLRSHVDKVRRESMNGLPSKEQFPDVSTPSLHISNPPTPALAFGSEESPRYENRSM